MNVADNIAIKLGLNKSDLVLREGNPVKFISDVDNKEDYIINRINELKNIGYKTIAVISKTEEMSIKLNSRLKLKGLDIPNIMLDDDLNDSRYNICTISNGLAKGLEFDAVIISDASNNIYKDNSLDMKLLYVAITRALHSLDIIYDSNIAYQLEE
jgi:DNA helicase-2/ATP-dependent DNA helicase PcrA